MKANPESFARFSAPFSAIVTITSLKPDLESGVWMTFLSLGPNNLGGPYYMKTQMGETYLSSDATSDIEEGSSSYVKLHMPYGAVETLYVAAQKTGRVLDLTKKGMEKILAEYDPGIGFRGNLDDYCVPSRLDIAVKPPRPTAP